MPHAIALFAYNRPEHTRKTLKALQNNWGFDPSLLHVFCDGAKRERDIPLVEETRQTVADVTGGQSKITLREENWGLSKSIINGVTELTEKFGSVIVVEDDLITSPQFLAYMTKALELYEQDERVMQISGYMFPVQIQSQSDFDAFFLPMTTSWGWATWRRAWRSFDPSMQGIDQLDNSAKLRFEFDLNGSYPYYKMLCRQRNGEINSFAIRWYLSVFLKRGLTLYPASSLVANIGFDGSGTHCAGEKTTQEIRQAPVDRFPPVGLDPLAAQSVFSHLRRQNAWWRKVWRRSIASFSKPKS